MVYALCDHLLLSRRQAAIAALMQVAFGPSLLFPLILPTFFSTLGGVFMPNFEKRWGAEESRGGDRKSNGKEIEGKYGMSCVKGKGEWDSEDNG